MSVSATTGLLVRGATLLTMDPSLGDIDRGDLRIESGRIAAIGKALAAQPGDEVVDGHGMLALPGLIDAHTHMWQGPLKGLGAAMWGMADYHKHIFSLRARFSAEDMHDAAFATGVEMLDNGITSVLDFCHNVMSQPHAQRSIDAHRKTGQRVLFCYGMLGDLSTLEADHGWRLEHVRGLAAGMDASPDTPVRLGMALGSLEYTGLAMFEREARTARELGLPMSFHQNVAGQVHELEAAGLLGPDMLPVHCNPALDAELELLASRGCGISFTPESEVGDGRSIRVMARAHRAGVTPSLGIDVPSRVALDLFSQMRLGFWLMRNDEAESERGAGRWPLTRYPGVPFIQPRHLLEYVTVNAARAIGLGHLLGRLAPGCIADLILLRRGAYSPSLGDPAAHVVLQSTPADVDTVIVGGRVLKRAGRLLDVARSDAIAATRCVRERLFPDQVQGPPGSV